MKKTAFIAAAVMAANMIFPAISANAADITIVVDGTKIDTPAPPVIVNDRTLVPLRAVSESFGFDVAWDAETEGITITDGEVLVFTWIGRDHAFKTSSMALEDCVIMETPPVIMNDYTMVPLRAVSELFGAQVNWDQASYTVDVTFGRSISVTSGLAAKFSAYEQVFAQKYEAYRGFVDGDGNVVNAEIQLENGGVIELELFPDIAPITVNNFVNLASSGFYDGLIFHRVIEGFMIQGGGFDTNYVQKEAPTITGEFIANGYFNLLPHEEGVISMARTMASMDSASSQFFIMHEHSHSLDGQYAAFGWVTSGMEYVNAIAETATGYNSVMNAEDVPVTPQIIKTIIIK